MKSGIMHCKQLLTFALCAIMTNSCVTDDEPAEWALGVGDSLPAFSVTLNDGKEVSDSSLKGKASVIVFFNTSCPDCRKELPVVQELWEHYKDNDEVEIFAIAREEGAESISSYWEENGLTIPWSAQNDRTVYSLFASSVIPRIFVSDRNLVINAAYGDKFLPTFQDLIDSVTFGLLF